MSLFEEMNSGYSHTALVLSINKIDVCVFLLLLVSQSVLRHVQSYNSIYSYNNLHNRIQENQNMNLVK